ncbi:transglutaminase domain-containing protein [bacterium]|nr:transglutaminase domain-containing protein [bacterium]
MIDNNNNNSNSNSNSIAFIIGIIVCCLFVGMLCLILFKPSNKINKNQTYSDKIIERKHSSNNINSLNIEDKIPVFKPGQKFNFKITRDIIFSGNLYDVTLTIKLPSDVPQRQKILSLSVNPTPKEIVTKNGEKYALIYIPRPSNQVTVSISGEAMVRTYNLNIAQKINKNIDTLLTDDDISYYLRPEQNIETNSKLIKSVARKKIPTATNKIDTVKNIFDFVVNYMTYDFRETGKDKGAVASVQSGRGVCEEFADLFVALCRAKGIPARVVEGFDLPFIDDRRDKFGGHAWAEVYFPEYGWVTFDPTNNLSDKIKEHAKDLSISPYDLLSYLNKYKSYLIIDAKNVISKYDGEGNIISKNLYITYY